MTTPPTPQKTTTTQNQTKRRKKASLFLVFMALQNKAISFLDHEKFAQFLKIKIKRELYYLNKTA